MLQNSGHGDVAFTMAQLGFVLATGLAVYLLPAAAAVLIWLREDRARIRAAGRAVREVCEDSRTGRAA